MKLQKKTGRCILMILRICIHVNDMREVILRSLYKIFPFSVKGDAVYASNSLIDKEISCIINFYGRIHLLDGILWSLATQDVSKDKFEVILVEDKGGTIEGMQRVDKFCELLNIRYCAVSKNYGYMGDARNKGFSISAGKYILFLDDDTVILQRDFLRTLIAEFNSSGADAVIPRGMVSYCLLKGRYDFHDPYYPTSRCMAYSRAVLEELRGFVSAIIGQEDVEFTIRFIAAGKMYHRSQRLWYLHPPFILNNLNKPRAVGISFFGLRKKYPLLIWLTILLNGLRFIPFLFFPFKKKWRFQGLFSLGFLIGAIQGMFGKKMGYN